RTQPRHDANSWILRELSGEGSPAHSNRQFRDLIARGAVGLDVIGDAPSVGCLDPDHPFARAAVGTQGVSICRLQDFRAIPGYSSRAHHGLSFASIVVLGRQPLSPRAQSRGYAGRAAWIGNPNAAVRGRLLLRRPYAG